MSTHPPQIFVAVGANLPSPRYGAPPASFAAALDLLSTAGIEVRALSRWYRSAPLPPSPQPDYINGVVEILADRSPRELLSLLHEVEEAFGRVRGVRNEARSLDLDLLAHGDAIMAGGGGEPRLPHPRLSQRLFVLLPLAELAPTWRHPVTGLTVGEMIAALPPGQDIEVLKA